MPNKKSYKLIINLVVLVLIIAIITGVSLLGSSRMEDSVCTSIRLDIKDSAKYKFVSVVDVVSLLDSSSLNPIGIQLSNIHTGTIEHIINGLPYIEHSEVYTNINGECVISITQRTPIIRVNSSNGYDFYVDHNYTILDPSDTPCDVLVFNGALNVSFSPSFYGSLDTKKHCKELEFLKKLITFAQIVQGDEMLSSLITQIWITQKAKIILTPRIGTQTIYFGELNHIHTKLHKLKQFYIKSFKTGWWQEVNSIRLDFKGQVVIK